MYLDNGNFHSQFKYLWTSYLETVSFKIGWNNLKTQINAFHTWGDMTKNIKMFAAENRQPDFYRTN